MTYRQQLDYLYDAMMQEFKDLIRKHGIESNLAAGEKTIKYDGKGRVPGDIKEFGKEHYWEGQEGRKFHYSNLSYDTLATIVDHLKKTVI